ncbi:hypothetical protein [Agarivorans sp. QJM3NY_33]|uniref:hypothetical protein n=1 Tax=Agarivorans sp. QJM3NY_33 TaxID=3421432 RepID=UPI003D7E4283
MMNSKLTISAIAALGLVLSLGAYATGKGNNNSSQRQQMPAYTTMDTNQDQRISADEFHAFKAQRIAQQTEAGRNLKNIANSPTFESLDSNGDQFLDQNELNHQRGMRQGGQGEGGQGKGRAF